MDSSKNLNIEPKEALGQNNHITNRNIEEHYQNLNIPLPNKSEAQITTTVHEVRQIIKKENDTGSINKIEYQLNSVPFKSLEEKQSYSSSPLNEINNNINKESNINPFSIKGKGAMHEINEVHYMSNKKNENKNENRYKSQNSEKIVNVFPNGTFKIELFKSKAKSRKTINDFTFMNRNNNALSLNNVIKEENDNYKLLIKKIASQLKKRRNPPTKGIFYMTIIKTETYLKKVKNIGNKMKIKVRKPTHGFFFKIIKKEQYKLLVKRIASQLKRRTRFPSCKIIKIYEPYRILIKKISERLKAKRNKRMIDTAKNDIINANHGNNVINNMNIYTNNNEHGMNQERYEKIVIDEEKKEINKENEIRFSNDSNKSFGNMNVLQVNNHNNIENTLINNDNVDHISKNACKVIREGKEIKSYPSLSKKGKNINIKMPLLKRENNLKLSEDKNKRNNTSFKIDINEVNDNINNNEFDNEELNTSKDLNISLSNIEVTKTNFIHDFDRFLNKTNIKIINNFPVSLEEKNTFYFRQNNFWFLIFNYLFYQSNCISLFTITSILEQYYIWCTDKNMDNFNSIKETIKEYINNNYNPVIISQFLFMNQLNSIDQIFQKYEKSIKNNENNFKEIKLNDLNIGYNQDIKCQCELCTNNEACIKKVADNNKKKLKVINNEYINFIGLQNVEKNCEKNNDIFNNEELFFKGKSKKKGNGFSKSKIIQSENTNLEYNITTKSNNNSSSNQEEIFEIDSEKNYRNNKEKEENDEEDKNKKKGKKRKKTKSKNKNKDKNSNRMKKRDSGNSDKNEEEDEKEEVKTKVRSKSKSKSKKKKKDKKSNKNNEEMDSEEKDQKDERDEIDD